MNAANKAIQRAHETKQLRRTALSQLVDRLDSRYRDVVRAVGRLW